MTKPSSPIPIAVTLAPCPQHSVSRFERCFFEPINRIGMMFLWTCVALVYILQGLLILLKLPPPVILHALVRMWLQLPADAWSHFGDTKLGQTLFLMFLFVFITLYCMMQTKKSIDEFILWAAFLSYHPSSSGPQRTQIFRRFPLLIASHPDKSFDLAFFLATKPLHIFDSLNGKGEKGIAVLDKDEPVTIVESTMAPVESIACTSSNANEKPTDRAAALPQPFVQIHVLNSFTMHLVVNSSTRIAIPCENKAYFGLLVYFVTHTYDRSWVSVEDILRDVYDCDDETGAEKIAKTKNLFHRHCLNLREQLADAGKEAGLSMIDVLENNRGNQSLWRLSMFCLVEDLHLLSSCKRMLAEWKTRNDIDEGAVKAACEQVYTSYTGDLLATLCRQARVSTALISRPMYVFVTIYLEALAYLAQDEHKTAVAETKAEAKRRHLQREASLWAAFALCCARTAFLVPYKVQEKQIEQGEATLHCFLDLCADLNDPITATHVFHEFVNLLQEDAEDQEEDDHTREPYGQLDPGIIEAWERAKRVRKE